MYNFFVKLTLETTLQNKRHFLFGFKASIGKFLLFIKTPIMDRTRI